MNRFLKSRKELYQELDRLERDLSWAREERGFCQDELDHFEAELEASKEATRRMAEANRRLQAANDGWAEAYIKCNTQRAALENENADLREELESRDEKDRARQRLEGLIECGQSIMDEYLEEAGTKIRAAIYEDAEREEREQFYGDVDEAVSQYSKTIAQDLQFDIVADLVSKYCLSRILRRLLRMYTWHDLTSFVRLLAEKAYCQVPLEECDLATERRYCGKDAA